MSPTAATKSRTDKAAAAAEAETGKKETVQQLKNRLRNEAEREVLNAHKAEVIKITEAKYDEHGLEYVRRLSEEEKAAKTIEEMYQKFPNLRPVTVVQADPGGALDRFRTGDYDAPEPGLRYEAEEADNYRDIDAHEGD